MLPLVPIVRIHIEPHFLGPASVGTITPIRILRDVLGMRLRDAKDCIDRCVFEGETVELEAPSFAAAEERVKRLNETPPPARVVAEFVPSR